LLCSCAQTPSEVEAFASTTPLLQNSLARRAHFLGAGPQVLELEKKEDWAGLVRLARERLLREPDNADWELIGGYGLLQLKDYRQAAAAFSRATQRSPEDIDAWNLLGESQRASGDPARAARTLERAATVSRTSQLTYFLLGEAYREDGRPDRAINAYRESVRLEPRFAPAWYGLGSVYLQTGRQEELKAVMEQLQKLNPALAEQLAKAGGKGK